MRVAILLVLVAACDDKPAAPVTSRTEGAKVAAQKGASTEAFCDVHYAAAKAPTFAWPDKLGAPEAPANTWRWINVWATWCRPCVEEIPLIVRSKGKLGAPIDLQLVSIDDKDSDVAEFRRDNPAVPATARLPDEAARFAWFKALGLDEAAPVPVHIFVDPQGRVRCARAGSVRESDLAVISKLLTE